jgi:sugar O-acyltransferase (sialic acid O-acetyltransferase NeuD family)
MQDNNLNDGKVCIVGYSGHGYVVIEALTAGGYHVNAYCDAYLKTENPYDLLYLGSEKEQKVLSKLRDDNYCFFVSIGNNQLRKMAFEYLNRSLISSVVANHPASIVSVTSEIGTASFIAAGAIVQSYAKVGVGVICNSGSIVEHQCEIGNFSHIAPGAVLCGNVHIGHETLIGAGSVINPGISIGNNVIVGSGSVVTRNIPDNTVFAGNPARQINV